MRIINELPLYHGVGASKLYLPVGIEAVRIYDYLCDKFAHIDTKVWRARFAEGKVLVAKKGGGYQVLDGDALYAKHQGGHIYYYRELTDETVVPFAHRVLFEHPRFLVVDKPHFLAITPTGRYVRETLLTRLRAHYGSDALTPMHRLDRDTAGLVLFCRDKRYRGAYQSLFAEQMVTKIYHAIAPFRTNVVLPRQVALNMVRGEPFYTMTAADGMPNSQTHIALIEKSTDGMWAKYRLTPITGKLHQLRVHMNHLGLPIKNDNYYPRVIHRDQEDFGAPLQLLAKSLSFFDPISGEHWTFESAQNLLL